MTSRNEEGLFKIQNLPALLTIQPEVSDLQNSLKEAKKLIKIALAQEVLNIKARIKSQKCAIGKW